MKKILALFLGLFLATLSSSALANEPGDQPVLSGGDLWEFRTNTRNSLSSTTNRLDGEYTVTYRGGNIEVTQDDTAIGGNAAEELQRMILPDERQYLKFPLAVGNKWTGKYYHDRRSGWRSMDYAVTGIEDIAIDGKILHTFKIEGKGTVSVPSGSYDQTRTIWYSLETKSAVKFLYDSAVGSVGAKVEIELVKYMAK